MTTPEECTCPPDGRRLSCPAHGGTDMPEWAIDPGAGVPAIVYPPPTDAEREARNQLAEPEPEATYAGTSVPLTQAPTIALGFALGYAVARPQSAEAFGPFCALVEAMAQRFGPRPGSEVPLSEWAVLVSLLPPDLTRRIEMLYQAQRGQRWARTGKRGPK